MDDGRFHQLDLLTGKDSPQVREEKYRRDTLCQLVPILCYFDYQHLPTNFQLVSKPFSDLAFSMAEGFLDMDSMSKAETVAGIRKLLEAKDCAVRAKL